MPMNAPRPQQGTPSKAPSHAALSQDAGVRRMDPSSSPGAPAESPKSSGYGLPCSKCRLYYPADLDICPTCKHHERVSPVVPRVPTKVAHATPAPHADSAVIEKEREEFLRQFKSQLLEAHAEAADAVDAPESVCLLGDHHPDEPATAEICKACYERLQEHLDICEAALHLDLKEAAQIIYDAVWADPSDPSKTYQNAASALLSELRKRAGMNSMRGPFHPLQH